MKVTLPFIKNERMQRYFKQSAGWIIAFYCIKGTAVTVAAIAAAYFAF